jgi:hypothetical protein
MTKSFNEILEATYGEVNGDSFTFGEALDHFANEVSKGTKLPLAAQTSLIEASKFMTILRSRFLDEKEWGKFRKAKCKKIMSKLELRFGKKNAVPESSKMIWIGAVDAKHLDGFLEANGKAKLLSDDEVVFRCEATSPTGLTSGINRYLEEVVGLQGEALLEKSAMSTSGRAKKIAALTEPKQPDQPEADAKGNQPEADAKPAASDPKDQATDQVEDQPKADTKPEQPKAEQKPKAGSKNQPTAEAVVEQLASQVEAYGFDSKDIANVLRLLSDRLQPKAEVKPIGKAKPKAAASKKQSAKKAA